MFWLLLILLPRRLERNRNRETNQIKESQEDEDRVLKAVVTSLTENEDQITANPSSCGKKRGRQEADTERGTDRKRQKPGAVKTAPTKPPTPAVRGRHSGKEGERDRGGLIRERAIE